VSNKKNVLGSCHSSGGPKHHDTNKTLGKVSERYYWPTLAEDVKEFCQSCEQCQGANTLVIYYRCTFNVYMLSK